MCIRDRLDSLATLFPDTPASQSATVPLRLAIQFRTRAMESHGSEQLISWELSSGSRSANYPNGNTRLDWYPGDGIVLSLNWANYSRWRPIPDSRQPDLVAEDQQASFLAQGAWSLFRMIAQHRVTDHIVHSDEEVTLGFVIPTRLDAAANPARNTSTRIYLALRSITPEPKIGLRFPYIAPMLD